LTPSRLTVRLPAKGEAMSDVLLFPLWVTVLVYIWAPIGPIVGVFMGHSYFDHGKGNGGLPTIERKSIAEFWRP
jgi:hypothetical protein